MRRHRREADEVVVDDRSRSQRCGDASPWSLAGTRTWSPAHGLLLLRPLPSSVYVAFGTPFFSSTPPRLILDVRVVIGRVHDALDDLLERAAPKVSSRTFTSSSSASGAMPIVPNAVVSRSRDASRVRAVAERGRPERATDRLLPGSRVGHVRGTADVRSEIQVCKVEARVEIGDQRAVPR